MPYQELVLVETGICPVCGAPTDEVTWVEEPLVRGCGYGAARETVVSTCTREGCDWYLPTSVGSVRPAA